MKHKTNPSHDEQFWSHPSIQGVVDRRSERSYNEEATIQDSFVAVPTTWWGLMIFRTVTFGCLFVIVSAALFHIWSQSQATQLGFVYSQLMKENKQLKASYVRLDLSIAKLKDLQRLHRIARQELGMQRPQASQVVSEHQVSQALRNTSKPGVALARARSRTRSSDTLRR
jgi:cell division protein FtsL